MHVNSIHFHTHKQKVLADKYGEKKKVKKSGEYEHYATAQWFPRKFEQC